ncbi:MAG: LPS-assembly protein LptD [Rhodospirillaceae bacterium]|nr:LPS-assembly protein LptD [Rhodospirillaceae bacterium]
MKLSGLKLVALLLSFAVFGLNGTGAWAALEPAQDSIPVDETDEMRFSADEMQHDRDLDIITARGNVKVFHGDSILTADVVVYNRRRNLVSASGNATLLEPTGDVVFAEFMELTGDMKTGIIQDLRAVLSDSSLLAASGGRRTAGNRLNMRNAVYSPCKLCEDDPTRPPLWQIKAVRVIHDKDRQTVEYSDAWLEVAGVPIIYTPYLSHPDPTVKRRSGFLIPTFGSSTSLGAMTATPYFLNIASNADATLTPIFTDKEGVIVHTEYRHRFTEGVFDARGSITDATSAADSTYTTETGVAGIRGHIAAKGRFDYDETWRWGFDLNRASDDTYMSRFGFNGDNTLPTLGNSLASRGFVEGFRKRNYTHVAVTDFQDLQEEDDGNTPLIMPLVDYNHVGEPDQYGGQTVLDVNFVSLSRDLGNDMQRLSLRGGWQLPHVTTGGSVYSLSTSLNGDFYNVKNLARSGGQDDFTGAAYRLTPQAALDWRYPLVREEGNVYQLFEPIAAAVVSPYGGNSDKIPNEDSRNFEFDDTNLFNTNRFSGIDRFEGGPRLNYGFKWGVFGREGGNTTLLLGQSYRYKADDTFAAGSGLEDNFSDIVGRIHVSPGEGLNMYYRTRLDKDTYEVRRNEVDLTAGGPALNLSTRYIFFDSENNSEYPGREEISSTVSSQFTSTWRGSIGATRDMAERDMRSASMGLTYEDECFVFSSTLSRAFFQNRDLHPEDSIIFRIVFKTLGEFSSDVNVINPNKP